MSSVGVIQIRKIKTITNPVIKRILNIVHKAGPTGEIVTAPNSISAFEFLINQNYKASNKTKRLPEYARRIGYFDIENCGNGRYAVKLSSKGSRAAQNLLYEEYTLPKNKKWDGNWHILMFDIKESHKYLRDLLTIKVVELGMLPLQNSVYIYPFEFNELLINLHNVYPNATQFLLSATASKIDGEQQLIKKFRTAKVMK